MTCSTILNQIVSKGRVSYRRTRQSRSASSPKYRKNSRFGVMDLLLGMNLHLALECFDADLFLTSPGRFYASLIMKLIVSQILLKYDLRLENESARTKWYWESFTMPYESTRVVLKERYRP